MEILIGILLVILVVHLVVLSFLAGKFDEIARMKGHDTGYMAWVFFTGIFGMIMVAALPDRGGKEQKETPKPEELPEI